MTPEYTPGQIVEGIINALQAEDVEAVQALIHLLALQDPQLAQDVYDVITKACARDREGAEKAALISTIRRM